MKTSTTPSFGMYLICMRHSQVDEWRRGSLLVLDLPPTVEVVHLAFNRHPGVSQTNEDGAPCTRCAHTWLLVQMTRCFMSFVSNSMRRDGLSPSNRRTYLVVRLDCSEPTTQGTSFLVSFLSKTRLPNLSSMQEPTYSTSFPAVSSSSVALCPRIAITAIQTPITFAFMVALLVGSQSSSGEFHPTWCCTPDCTQHRRERFRTLGSSFGRRGI